MRYLQSAQLELTKRCNLNCYHCYVAGSPVRLPTSRWLDVVDELEAEGCSHVTLTGGEVGLRRDWLEVSRAGQALPDDADGTDQRDSLLLGRHRATRRLAPVACRRQPVRGDTQAAHERVTGVAGVVQSLDGESEGTSGSWAFACRVGCPLMPDTFPEVDGIVGLAEELDCRLEVQPNRRRARPTVSAVGPRLPLCLSAQVRGVLGQQSGCEPRGPRVAPGRRAAEAHDPAPPVYCGAGVTAATIEANGDVLRMHGVAAGLRERGDGHRFMTAWAWIDLPPRMASGCRPLLMTASGFRFLDHCTARLPTAGAG